MADSTVKNAPPTRHGRRSARDRSSSDRGDIVRDVTRLTWAWTQACNETVFDAIQIAGDLTMDVTDSILGRGSRTDTTSPRDGGVISDVSDSLSKALRDTSDVLSRSGNRFSKMYDDERTADDAKHTESAK